MRTMKQVDHEFQGISGLTDRRLYKLFYSHVHPFPVMVLGLNPGGSPDGHLFEAADPFYGRYEHDYLMFRSNPAYALAGAMSGFLAQVLKTRQVDVLRQVPATNVVFRRSPASEGAGPAFARLHGMSMSMRAAFNEGRPVLQDIISTVDPEIIFLVSATGYGYFQSLCSDLHEGQRIVVPNGKNDSLIYVEATARIAGLDDRPRTLIVTGHPSKYARRIEWATVVERAAVRCKRLGVSPLDRHPLVRTVSHLPDHGVAV